MKKLKESQTETAIVRVPKLKLVGQPPPPGQGLPGKSTITFRDVKTGQKHTGKLRVHSAAKERKQLIVLSSLKDRLDDTIDQESSLEEKEGPRSLLQSGSKS